MWTVVQGGGTCGAEEWAVVDGDGNTDSCYADEASAQAAADGLNAPDAAAAEGWHAWALPMDVWTTDGRMFAAAGAGHRDLPLPLRVIFQDTGYGHDGAITVGSITELLDDNGVVFARGTWDPNAPEAARAAEMVANGTLRWVSADTEVTEEEYVEVLADGSESPIVGDMWDWMPSDDTVEVRWRAMRWNLAGLTILDMPAFPQAVIVPESVDLPNASVAGTEAAVGMGIPQGVAASLVAAAVPEAPPAEWFDRPDFDGPTALAVTEGGRVSGHLAPWDECHVGREVCVTAPTSPSGYAYFRTGSVLTAEGAEVPTGPITLGTGHADERMAHRPAAAHYDDTGTAVADVACGEDEYGIWIAGALRPGVTDEQVRALRGSGISGDWRRIGGALELVAALAVNTPGFPVMRTFVAAGVQQSLVAAVGSRRLAQRNDPLRAEIAELRKRLERVENIASPLRSAAADAIAASAARG